jgi:hypothetical protein
MWIKEQSDVKLSEFDDTNKGLIIQRKNFRQIEINDEVGTRSEWECETRHITVDDYYREKQDKAEADIDYIAIMTGVDL